MSFTDWSTGQNVGARKQSSMLVCTSTIEDFGHIPSTEEQTRDEAQKAVTGRRSWKTVRGGSGEAVWSPQLEAALIEGLEKYQPESKKATKSLGRFPMRNRFISDYVFQVTGKRRTPKQVGSRIQQLRDTCKGEHILRLISRNSGSSGSVTPEPHCSPDPSPSPTSSTFPPENATISASTPTELRQRIPTQLSVSISTSAGSSSSRPPYIFLDPPQDMQRIRLGSIPDTMNLVDHRASKMLASMDPSVMIVSGVQLWEQYDIFLLESESRALVYKERCQLQPCPSTQVGQWIYRTALVQGRWKDLCYDQFPEQYVIHHSFVPLPSVITASNKQQSVYTGDEISVLYFFDGPAYTTPSDNLYSRGISYDQSSSGFPSSMPFYEMPPDAQWPCVLSASRSTDSWTQGYNNTSTGEQQYHYPYHGQ
ncbi:TEC1 family protein [Pleurotus pulmonarius]|nr:hypothetical protein EYR38_007582 [Pleurotus pulmonarius]